MNSHHHRTRTTTLLLLAPTLLLLAPTLLTTLLTGCTTTHPPIHTYDPTNYGPPPEATPRPITCTPLTGNTTPTPCTQAEHDKLRQQLTDYTAAEKVYRAFFDEDTKLMKTGDLATPEIKLLLAGPMIDRYEKEKADQHDIGLTTTGAYTLSYVRASSVPPYPGSDLTLDTCIDGSAADGSIGGKFVSRGAVIKGHAYLTRSGTSWKLWWTDGQEVASC